MKIETIQKLEKIVGANSLSVAEEDLLCYSYDGTAQEFLPEAVVFPESTGQVAAIMALASQQGFVVIPRGAGSGMTGGALAVRGGLVMAMSRMNRILEVDRSNQVAVVEPGVITADLQKRVKEDGLFYPPDPASLKFCTIGGNVAECAGGPSAVKYGVTRDYVRGLEVVLASGKVITTGVRTAKGVVGYDLTRLFVGSEGTLGVITKMFLRLIPLPEAKQTFLVLTDTMGRAAALVCEILTSHLPCTLEYVDKTALGIVADKIPFQLDPATGALLLVELDGTREGVKAESAKLASFLGQRDGLIEIRQAEDQAEVDLLWSARRAVSPAAFQLRPNKISEDVVVPRDRIPDLVAFVEQLSLDLGLIIFTFGHAGDGNIHVNIMVDRQDADELARGEQAKKRLFDRVISLDGTLSGEHGVGITKAAYLPLEIDPATLETMQGVKRLFDPANILNPGKIFPQSD